MGKRSFLSESQIQRNKYTIHISSFAKFDHINLLLDGNIIDTITGHNSVNGKVYHYSKEISIPIEDWRHEIELDLAGYTEDSLIGQDSMRFYIYEAYSENEQCEMLYLPQNVSQNRILDEPRYDSIGRPVPVNSWVSLIGAYPSREDKQYYYVRFESSDDMMVRYGFVPVYDVRMISGNPEILSCTYQGEQSGLNICVPFAYTDGDWQMLHEVEKALVHLEANVPVISLFKPAENNTYSFVRFEEYDTLYGSEEETVFVFEFLLDVTGMDKAAEADGNTLTMYCFDASCCTSYTTSANTYDYLTVYYCHLIKEIRNYPTPGWEMTVFTPLDNLYDGDAVRTISSATSVLNGWLVDSFNAEYFLFIEDDGSSRWLRSVFGTELYFPSDVMQNITEWKIKIEKKEALFGSDDYELTVSLKSTERLPTNGNYRILYRWENNDGNLQYGWLRVFEYNQTRFTEHKVKLLSDEQMNITYNTTYEFQIFPWTNDSITVNELVDHFHDIQQYTYSYIFEDGTAYDDDKYYEMLHQYMLAGENALDDEKLSDYVVRRMCNHGVQTNDAKRFVEKLKSTPGVYRNLYLESISNYNLGNLYTDKQPNRAAAYYDPKTHEIIIQNYYYSSATSTVAAITFFHESGHAIDHNAAVYQVGNDETLFVYLRNDLKSVLRSQLDSLGYSQDDQAILLVYLLSAKNKPEDIDTLLQDINQERLEHNVSRCMILADYNALRESLYSYFTGVFGSVESYGNALMVTDVSNGLMNDKIYTTDETGAIAYYPGGHWPKIGEGLNAIPLPPENEIYWYNKDGSHTEMMCREAWAEWYASQISGNQNLIDKNMNMYPNATGYMDDCAKKMLKYYLCDHTGYSYNQIMIDEQTGGFSIH